MKSSKLNCVFILFFVTVNHTSPLDLPPPPRLRCRISALALGKENNCKAFNHVDL